MTNPFSARRLDLKAFAEAGEKLASEQPLRDFPRVLAETEGRGPETPVEWTATGELRNPGHVNPQVWMALRADALLPLTCQRCLQPVDVEVEVDRTFRFVTDEETAAAEDDESEEDVLALSRSFDLAALVEDELLMALPLAPRHDVCPQPMKMSAGEDEVEPQGERENPFAVLGKLKGGKA